MKTTPNNPEAKILSLLEEAEIIRIKNPKQSIVLAKEAHEHAKQLNEPYLIAKSLSRLAYYFMINGIYDQSTSTANEAAAIYESINHEKGLAAVKFTIASINYKTDNLLSALKNLIECLTVFRKYDDHLDQAKCYKALGTIYEFYGDEENAILSYESAIESSEKANDTNMLTNVYNPLSGLYLNQNKLNKSKELIEKSITLKEKSGDIRGLGFAYYGRGKYFIKIKEYKLAETDLKKSLDIHIEMGEKLGASMTYQKMGVLYLEQGKFEQAKEFLLKSFEQCEVYNIRLIKNKTCYCLYEVYKKQHKLQEALYYLEKYHKEMGAHVQDHTYQIVSSYNMVQLMKGKADEDRLQLEKIEILEKKNQAEYEAKAKQEFLSNMSHEIRTPLNAVITIPKLLKERTDPEDQQLLESLKFASNNLLLLINDILDFSKLEAGKMELEKRPTDLIKLLHNIKNTYNSMAVDKGLQLKLDIDNKIEGSFSLDEVKLTQILGNLLSNAIKFTDNGFVGISVKKITETPKAVELNFKVTDTGAGIPDDFLAEIFESFTQPKSITTKKHGGTGLGLAIVKKLAGLYNSEVKIETKLNEGTVFSFDLILEKAEITDVKLNTSAAPLKKLNVLLAEDNTINMKVASMMLSRWGITVEGAKNGLEAVEKASAKKYDVILMDIHMPEMNGYDATIKIRQTNNINKDTAIFALTADVTSVSNESNVSYFNGFLRKPIETEELFRALSAVA
jgi:signal transduction histidine kinase/CheY-like chemotaxis protein